MRPLGSPIVVTSSSPLISAAPPFTVPVKAIVAVRLSSTRTDPCSSEATTRGVSRRNSPFVTPMRPTMTGDRNGPLTVKSASAVPAVAMPVANAPRTRRSSPPLTTRSTRGSSAVMFVPPEARMALPSESQCRSASDA